MANKYVRQLFTKGLDGDVNPIIVDLGTEQTQVVEIVTASSNLVFERGVMQSRLPIKAINNASGIPNTETILAVQRIGLSSTLPTNLLDHGLICITTDGAAVRLYWLSTKFSTQYAATQITGPGLGIAWHDFNLSVTVANGIVLIGGNNQGLIRWDPTTNVYTILATAQYAFVGHQFSRALAAHKVTAAIGSPITVAASAPGDETDWTSLQAYSTILTDASDEISGLEVVKGVVVLARAYGFHLGFPTGQFPNIYNWQMHSEDSIGCAWPCTLATWKNLVFFCSDNGVHTFDLVDVTDIGEGVYKQIAARIKSAHVYQLRGFVSSSYYQDLQPTYNLFLDTFTAVVPTNDHWMYNIREQKWSHHVYTPASGNENIPIVLFAQQIYDDTAPITGYARTIVPSIGCERRGLAGFVPNFSQWDFNTPTVDTDSYQFTSGTFTFVPTDQDAQLARILFYYFATNAALQISVQVTSVLDGITTVGATITKTPGVGGFWNRVWLDIPRTVGHAYSILVQFTNVFYPFVLREVLYEFSVAGKVRN